MVRKSLFLVIPTIRQGGGAARVFVAILRHLDRSKYKISLVVNLLETENMPSLPEDIKVFDLNAKKARYAIFHLIALLWREKPDLVLSTMSHLNVLISIFRPMMPRAVKFIVRETNTISEKIKYQPSPVLFKLAYRYFYKKIDTIVAQSDHMKKDMVENFDLLSENITVIQNPIDTEEVDFLAGPKKRVKGEGKLRFVAVGRLEYQKGFDLLLKAAKLIEIDYTLEIYGAGSEHAALQKLVEELGLENKVKFRGYEHNPYKKLVLADIFLLSSRYEGLPNAAIEANYLGLPVVAFRSPGGIEEIIQEGINGFLVKPFDLEAFAINAVRSAELLQSSDLISSEAKKTYNAQSVIKKYERLIDSQLAG